MAEFTEKWEGAPVDLSFLHMCLDASETALEMKFGRGKATPAMVIEFSRTVIQQVKDEK